jgi:hypothetical protein
MDETICDEHNYKPPCNGNIIDALGLSQNVCMEDIT